MKNNNTIFIIGKDPIFSFWLMSTIKEKTIYSTREFVTAGEALQEIASNKPKYIIIDDDKKESHVQSTLLKIKPVNSTTKIIVLSSEKTVENALLCFHSGASSVVIKNKETIEKLLEIIN